MNILHILVILWPLGFVLETVCRKKALALCDKKRGILPEEVIQEDIDALDTTYKYFKASFIVQFVTLLLGLLQPFKALKWLGFFASAMTTVPVLYDFFETDLKTFNKSKIRFLNSLPSSINFFLAAITMFSYYFAYIRKVF